MGYAPPYALICQNQEQTELAVGFRANEVRRVTVKPANRHLLFEYPQGDGLVPSFWSKGRDQADLAVVLRTAAYNTWSEKIQIVMSWGVAFKVWPAPIEYPEVYYMVIWPDISEAKRRLAGGYEAAGDTMTVNWPGVKGSGTWGGWYSGVVIWTTYEDFAAGTSSTAKTGQPAFPSANDDDRAEQVQTAARPNAMSEDGQTTYGELALASVTIPILTPGEVPPA